MTFDKKYEDTIRIVNLEHETLKLMRRTWALRLLMAKELVKIRCGGRRLLRDP